MARQKKADPEKAADSRKLLEEVRAKCESIAFVLKVDRCKFCAYSSTELN